MHNLAGNAREILKFCQISLTNYPTTWEILEKQLHRQYKEIITNYSLSKNDHKWEILEMHMHNTLHKEIVNFLEKLLSVKISLMKSSTRGKI